jgi:hypothetical protein
MRRLSTYERTRRKAYTGLLPHETIRLWRLNENDSDKKLYGSLIQRDEKSVMVQ